MDSMNIEMRTPATAVPYAAVSLLARPKTAPISGMQGSGLPFAGGTFVMAAATAAHVALAAVAGVRSTDLPGPVPRGAPV